MESSTIRMDFERTEWANAFESSSDCMEFERIEVSNKMQTKPE